MGIEGVGEVRETEESVLGHDFLDHIENALVDLRPLPFNICSSHGGM